MTRTITTLRATKAIDDDNVSGILEIPKGKAYSIELTLDRGDYWLITLAYGAGDWLFEKSSISFSDNFVINYNQAQHIFKRSITKSQIEDLNACLRKFKITTISRLRNFMGQTAHESGGLRWLKELASGTVYNGRRDLGNIYPGDGPKYKGAGVIQLTGRANYQAFANYIQDPNVMQGCDYVARVYPFTSAGFWWMNNNMNAFCDRGATVAQITKKVNGGYNGLSDRIYYYNRACQVIK